MMNLTIASGFSANTTFTRVSNRFGAEKSFRRFSAPVSINQNSNSTFPPEEAWKATSTATWQEKVKGDKAWTQMDSQLSAYGADYDGAKQAMDQAIIQLKNTRGIPLGR